MKKLKKILSVFTVIALIFGISVVGAFGAKEAIPENLKGSITIKDSPTVSVSGKNFRVVQLLRAELVDRNDISKGITYRVPENLKPLYAEICSIDINSANFDNDVIERMQTISEDNVPSFVFEFLYLANRKDISPEVEYDLDVPQGAHEATVDVLLGYYAILETTNFSTHEEGGVKAVSGIMVDTTTPNAVIKLKADVPSVVKKIDGDKDTDPSTSGLVSSNSASIGDVVPFVITTKVPDVSPFALRTPKPESLLNSSPSPTSMFKNNRNDLNTSFMEMIVEKEKYIFVIEDTLSKGLIFNNDVVVKIQDVVLTPEIDYQIHVENKPDGTTMIGIRFVNCYNHFKQVKDAPIEITYTATVDTDAVIGPEGNTNKVHIIYSNDPFDDTSTGITPDSYTKTFVTALEIHKIDADKNRLTGAEFRIEGERLNTVLVVKDVFTLNPSGEYWKLKNGSYTNTAPADLTSDNYESTTDKYILSHETETITKTDHVVYTGIVGADGVLRFEGLGAGEYTITEVKAPDGYNLLKTPVNVTITCGFPENVTEQCTWTVSENAAVVNGIVNVDIENHSGSELPSTGGMGTKIIYIVGGILLVGAAVLLIVKKRMAADNS